MSIQYSPLPVANKEYSQVEENFFRRTAENALIRAYSEIISAVSGMSGEASPAAKRTSLLSIPVSVKFSNLSSHAPYGDSNDATPSVRGLNSIVMTGTGVYNITDLLHGEQGQEVTVYGNNSLGALTIKYDATKILLSGNADLVFGTSAASLYSNVTLVKNGVDGIWVEKCRTIRA